MCLAPRTKSQKKSLCRIFFLLNHRLQWYATISYRFKMVVLKDFRKEFYDVVVNQVGFSKWTTTLWTFVVVDRPIDTHAQLVSTVSLLFSRPVNSSLYYVSNWVQLVLKNAKCWKIGDMSSPTHVPTCQNGELQVSWRWLIELHFLWWDSFELSSDPVFSWVRWFRARLHFRLC